MRQQLRAGIAALVFVCFSGTLGYTILEGWSLSDSFYMTIITLTTVGYSEVQPLQAQGKLFTIALIFSGVISIGYIVNRFTEAILQGYFQDRVRVQRQQKVLKTLFDHYIICGFGRTGQHIASEFYQEGVGFVVVDLLPDLIQLAQDLDYVAMQGDATLDDTLQKVGIGQASCLIAALPSDAKNLYTVLSAKSLNPTIRAITRVSSEEAAVKLRRGGADAVISPYTTAGRQMATAALRPQVMHFVDGMITGKNRSLLIEEFAIQSGRCPFIGQSLQQMQLRSRSGVLLLAILRQDGTVIGPPTRETLLLPQDILICMGTAEQIRLLKHFLDPISPQSRYLN
ncbi:potassium channel family protein [Roseofilum casamattae]|uniref:NAD-binding protein n=1 Tax=Roseofilum casamattae BLCC-M143 TaxID=3022442 RepID=A0ABT7BSI1_9CYAN|nr:NAD-binding protein [Roseofilum casamattae BLCC-M143]